MQDLKKSKRLLFYGFSFLTCGIILTVLTLIFTLDFDKANRGYSLASAIICALIVFGQLITMTTVTSFALYKRSYADDDDDDKYHFCYWFSIQFLYFIILFSYGAGQLVVVVLMSIDAGMNTATNVRIFGGFIAAFTVIYMLISFIYSAVIIKFYRIIKWNEDH